MEARAQNLWVPSAMSILDEFASFQRSVHMSETTIRNRDSILRNLHKHAGAPLEELTIRELRAFMGREGASPGTRVTWRTVLRAFYGWLVYDDYRPDDPTLKLAKVHAPKGEPRPFTPAQVEAMLHAGAYKRTRAMIILGYYQGFRVSSIARVHGRDIDVDAMLIRTIGKGGKDRHLPLRDEIAELAKYMPRDGYWFPARGGRDGHVLPNSVTNLITLSKKRAGIVDPTLTPHSLRHSFASNMVENGIGVDVVQKLMMHESMATTQVYLGVSDRRKREGIAALPTLVLPVKSGRKLAA